MNEIRRDLEIHRMMNIKPNYSELARKHGISRDTIRKYDNGYGGKPKNKPKASKLDKYESVIKSKLEIDGMNVSSAYQYFFGKDNTIGSESNFRKYVVSRQLKPKRKAIAYPRFETAPGHQLQFDWKENVQMVNAHGELFEFNIFAAVLSNSRQLVLNYSKSRIRQDVIRCLLASFKEISGIPKVCLTDNMSSIIPNGVICKEMITLSKDFNFDLKRCRAYSPQTKGKIESKNRFVNWLKPYNGEFETEEELIDIIKKIQSIANEKPNGTTLMPPNLLFQKKKEYLRPLPNERLFDHYFDLETPLKVSKESLITFRKCKYSVPMKYINKTVYVKIIDGSLHIYYSKELVQIHAISDNAINYNKQDYTGILKEKLPYLTDSDIDVMASENLRLLDNIGEKGYV